MHLLKRLASRFVPPPVLKFLRIRHYVRTLPLQSLDSEPDLKVVRWLVDPGDSTVDIGANVGDYSSFLSHAVGPEGRVFSIEPVPQTFELLTQVARKLKLENLQFMNCALSDIKGSQLMEIPTYESGLENFYQARIVGEPSDDSNLDRVDVATDTIDNLFLALEGEISFIKVDVEGHELACLRGGKQFLACTHCAWLIEIPGNPDEASSPSQQVFEAMLANDYEAWWFDGAKLRRRKPGDRSINYFFLKRHHFDRLKAKQPALLATGDAEASP